VWSGPWRFVWVGGWGSSHPSALGDVRGRVRYSRSVVSFGLEVGAAATRRHSGMREWLGWSGTGTVQFGSAGDLGGPVG